MDVVEEEEDTADAREEEEEDRGGDRWRARALLYPFSLLPFLPSPVLLALIERPSWWAYAAEL